MKKLILFCSFFLLCLITINSSEAAESEIKKIDRARIISSWDELQYGRKELLKRDYGSAIEDFTDVLGKNRHDIIALWLRSTAYIYSKQLDLAVKDIETLIQMNPADYANSLGISKQEVENYKYHLNLYTLARLASVQEIDKWKAVYEESRKKAEEINKDLPFEEAKKGMSEEQWKALSPIKKIERLERVDFERGLKFYGVTNLSPIFRTKDLSPGLITTFKNGNDNYNKGNYQQAIDDYTKVIKASMTFYDAYINRGLAYRKLNNLKLAFADFTKVINLNPNYSSKPYIQRSILLDFIEKKELALNDLNNAIELEPNSDFAYWLRGDIYESLNKFELALNDYNKAIELDPNDPDYYSSRAQVYKKLGKKQLALNDEKRAKELEQKQ